MTESGKQPSRRAGLHVRDWLLANDPAFSRLRLGLRVTLTIVISTLILAAVHVFAMPLPPAAYSIGIVLSIQGGLTVRDISAADQLKTRAIGCLFAVAAIALAAVLEPWRIVSDVAFLVIIFAASLLRAFGTRWAAVGMFAFMSYFIGAYLHPAMADIPYVALGALTAAATAHVVRIHLLPDDWRRDFLRAMVSVLGRVDHIVSALLAIAEKGEWTAEDRAELNRLEERLKEAVLMADGLVPVSRTEALPDEDDPAADIGLRLFDLHLAAESAIVLSRQGLPRPLLLQALLSRDEQAVEREAAVEEKDERLAETVRALLWLQAARAAAVSTTAKIEASDFHGLAQPKTVPASPAARPEWSLGNPAVRTALQITLASGIAMIFGLMLSRDRWFWAVLSAFLVFTNTNSRGDTAIKAAQRSGGTLLGISCGMVLATLLSGFPGAAILVAILCVFLAFYWLQVSYTAMTFFVSIVICLVYGLTGALTLDLLRLRLEETLIGTLAGAGVAFLVFPTRTQSALDTALNKWFDTLRQLLAAGTTGATGAELIGLSKKLDAAYRDVATAARPLGVSWQIVTRPGHIRQTLAILMASTYWARVFASRFAFAGEEERVAVQPAIAATRVCLERVATKGTASFFIKRKAPPAAGRHLPLSHQGSRLGIEMLGASLDRLHPER
ncbi:FUSC family protein [Rhizobium sp. LjRoot30]|uniref:FUSC family protein n=1 Tax=Rhizobium sp. LjRoot30 TaxID=3342320 RepID=UPI003F5016B4